MTDAISKHDVTKDENVIKEMHSAYKDMWKEINALRESVKKIKISTNHLEDDEKEQGRSPHTTPLETIQEEIDECSSTGAVHDIVPVPDYKDRVSMPVPSR